MYKGQKSVRNGIEDILYPCENMYISQGSNGAYSHKGIMANDVRGIQSGVKEDYWMPCTAKCMGVYPVTGQSMWQSINKVRFSNGVIDYFTFMFAHYEGQLPRVGDIKAQGEFAGKMGRKGYSNMTGVHVHIQTSKGNSTRWFENKYGIYQFENEVDLDDVFFVDNTNIIKGMGGNWKTTDDIPVEEKRPEPSEADQILYKGSKVKFDGIFKVDILKSPVSSNLFGCCELTGCTLNNYKNEVVNDYHWIPTYDFTEVDKYGNSTKDQVLTGGKSYILNKNIYEVKDIDVKTNSALLNISGRNVWVYSTYLYEVSNN